MPNWCAGTLRIRGKKKDLQNFVIGGLEPLPKKGNEAPVLELDGYGNVDYSGTCYIKGTNRGLVYNLDAFLEGDEDDSIKTITLDVEFAWSISSEELLKVCQKYHVDMRIYAFEREGWSLIWKLKSSTERLRRIHISHSRTTCGNASVRTWEDSHG